MNKIKKHISLFLLFALIFGMAFVFESFPTVEAATNQLVAYYKFDGNVKDYSGFGNDGTIVGKISYVDGKIGKGAQFDGESYIEVKDNDSIDLKESKFTLAAWYYKDDISPLREQPLLSKMESSIDENWPSYCLSDRDSVPYVQVIDNDTNYAPVELDDEIDFQQWTHIAATYDGNYVKIYINGTLKTNRLCKGFVPSSSGMLAIGFNDLDGSSFFKGIMDEIRIYNYVLSPADVKTVYDYNSDTVMPKVIATPTPTPTPTPDPIPVNIDKSRMMTAYYKFDGDCNDSSGNGNHGTPVGEVSFVDGKIGKGVKLTGNNYVTVKDNDLLEIKTAFSVSVWIKKSVKERFKGGPILTKRNSTPASTYSYLLFDQHHIQTFRCLTTNAGIEGGFIDIMTGGGPIDENQWALLTVTWDGKLVKFYINEKLMHEKSFKGNAIESNENLDIGADISSQSTIPSDYFEGIMDDLRLYNYALTGIEVKRLYDSANAAPTVTPTVTPAATSGIHLAAEPGANQAVKLSWNSPTAGSRVVGFKLYRGTVAGGEKTSVTDFMIPLVSNAGGSYNDKNVVPGTTYYYICKAVYSDNTESDPSNEVSATVGAAAAKNTMILQVGNPNMTANDQTYPIDSAGTCPIVVDGRTLVPIRAIVEPMGGMAVWDDAESKITLTVKGKIIQLWLDKKEAIVDGQKKTMDVPPQLINSRTMIPLRFIIENLGCEVIWDNIIQTVKIMY